MKIVICGSMTFAKEMMLAKEKLEKMGHEVVVPIGTEGYVKGLIRKSESEKEKIERDCIREYNELIKNSDAILVLNERKKGISGYIGANTFLEMGFAHVNHKKIFLMNKACKMEFYRDEIAAMPHMVLNGDLSLIK